MFSYVLFVRFGLLDVTFREKVANTSRFFAFGPNSASSFAKVAILGYMTALFSLICLLFMKIVLHLHIF